MPGRERSYLSNYIRRYIMLYRKQQSTNRSPGSICSCGGFWPLHIAGEFILASTEQLSVKFSSWLGPTRQEMTSSDCTIISELHCICYDLQSLTSNKFFPTSGFQCSKEARKQHQFTLFLNQRRHLFTCCANSAQILLVSRTTFSQLPVFCFCFCPMFHTLN